METPKQHFDIIIVGAGLIGLSLALALTVKKNQQQTTLKIAILEHHLPTTFTHSNTSLDDRPLTLNYASQQILKQIDCWEVLAQKACPIHSVLVSQEKTFGSVHFHARDYQIPALGFVIPMHQLQATLYEHISDSPHITMIPIQKILSLQCNEDQSTVRVEERHSTITYSCNLLIGADGAHSTCRDLLNIQTQRRKTEQVAQVIKVDLINPHQYNAYERFTRQGILAVLPLQHAHKVHWVWTLNNKIADEIKSWDQSMWQQFWNKHFGLRVGEASQITQSNAYPLQWMIATEQIRPGFILLGNAAHTIYPLAAQGFNLGLKDVSSLASILQKIPPKKFGCLSTLQKYLDRRQTPQTKITELTLAISELFELKIPGIKKFRGLGLLGIDLHHTFKRKLGMLWTK